MLFNFEADFVDGLRCIPMAVRLKLDLCGIKLKLSQWQQLSPEQRLDLVDLPCTSTAEAEHYRQALCQVIWQVTGQEASRFEPDPMPEWADPDRIPATVAERAAICATPIGPEQWSALSEIQRFALIKLSRSSHEHRNFVPALREFGLKDPAVDLADPSAIN